MNDAAQYKISTIADILALTPDQRVRCAADLCGWMNYVNTIAPFGDRVKAEPYFIWVDDDLPPGTISRIHIRVEDVK